MYVNRKSNKVYNVFKLKWNEPIEPAVGKLLLADGYMASLNGASMLYKGERDYYAGDYIIYDDSGIKEILTKHQLNEHYMPFEGYNRASVDKVTRFLRRENSIGITKKSEGTYEPIVEKGK